MDSKLFNGVIVYPNGTFFSLRYNRFLKPYRKKNGYYTITINSTIYKVHRLVASCFLNNSNNYPQVNHKDGDKSNNTIENLEWCTASHNLSHAYRTGLNKFNSKFKPWQVKAVRLFLKHKMYSRRQLSEHLNMPYSSVVKIALNLTYAHI